MQDILLEPYGGHVLGLPVGATTAMTALLAVGGLVGFGTAARLLGRGWTRTGWPASARWPGWSRSAPWCSRRPSTARRCSRGGAR